MQAFLQKRRDEHRAVEQEMKTLSDDLERCGSEICVVKTQKHFMLFLYFTTQQRLNLRCVYIILFAFQSP